MRYSPEVTFPVSCNGKRLTASVLEEIDHPVQTIFRVSFSNGFQDIFYLYDDGSVAGTTQKAAPYAKAIRFDIGHMIGLDTNRFFYHFPEKIDGLKTNVWIVEGDDENGDPIYKVYYFDFFRFALQKQEQVWVVSHQPQFGKLPDEKMICKVGRLLNTLLEEESK